MLKFICPNCGKETKIEVVMDHCVVSETVEFEDDGEAIYGFSEVNESHNVRYQCFKCGYVIPVEPDDVGDDILFEWLKEQPYNKVTQ